MFGMGITPPTDFFFRAAIRILCCSLLATPLWQSAAAQTANYVQPLALDRIVAIVNDDVIVASELANRLRLVRSQLRSAGTRLPPDAALQKQVLDRLIVDRLQLQVAELTGVRVDGESLNRSLQEMARKNGYSLRDFRDILQRDGYEFSRFREDIRQQMLLARVRQQQVAGRIRISEREIDNFLTNQVSRGNQNAEYHLSHILIAIPEGASPEQIQASRNKGLEVLKKLDDDADFSQLAVQLSDGQQALKGGDLGWRKRGQLPTVFLEHVPKLPVGTHSQLIRSASGFHIVKLQATRGGASERHVIAQSRVRHILIRPNELTSEEDAKSRLLQLKQRLQEGADFATLARSGSDDRGSAIKGGGIGWVSTADVVPAFAEIMDTIPLKEISAPFKSSFGWHILQVMERRNHDNTKTVRRTQAVTQIRERKLDEELQSWIRRLRDEAHIEYRLEE